MPNVLYIGKKYDNPDLIYSLSCVHSFAILYRPHLTYLARQKKKQAIIEAKQAFNGYSKNNTVRHERGVKMGSFPLSNSKKKKDCKRSSTAVRRSEMVEKNSP
jgi:hypothetical protein